MGAIKTLWLSMEDPTSRNALLTLLARRRRFSSGDFFVLASGFPLPEPLLFFRMRPMVIVRLTGILGILLMRLTLSVLRIVASSRKMQKGEGKSRKIGKQLHRTNKSDNDQKTAKNTFGTYGRRLCSHFRYAVVWSLLEATHCLRGAHFLVEGLTNISTDTTQVFVHQLFHHDSCLLQQTFVRRNKTINKQHYYDVYRETKRQACWAYCC